MKYIKNKSKKMQSGGFSFGFGNTGNLDRFSNLFDTTSFGAGNTNSILSNLGDGGQEQLGGLLGQLLGLQLDDRDVNQTDPFKNLNQYRVSPSIGFEKGGIVNTTGYLKGAKTNKNPFNLIPSSNITTKNMIGDIFAIPLLGNGGFGKGMILKPNSGDYNFGSGVSSVLELPMFAKGGRVSGLLKKHGLSGVNKPKKTPKHPTKSHVVLAKEGDKTKLIRFGQQGVSGSPKKEGESKKSAARRKSFKARHAKNIKKGKMSAAYWSDVFKWANGGFVQKFQQGGFANNPIAMIPIQTEKGEVMFLQDNLSLVNVKAKDLHKNMDKDRITDIVPEGTYIFSDDKKQILSKKKAEKIELGMRQTPYNEFASSAEPEILDLATLFPRKKNKATPADLVRKVKRDFEIVDRDDIFTTRANDENRVGRLPYIQGIIQMAESKKGNDVSFGTPQFQEGGLASILGGLGPVLQGAGAISNIFGNIQNRRRANQMLQDNIFDINNTAQQQAGLQSLGTGFGIASLLGQDTNVQAPQLSSAFINQIQTQVPQGVLDFERSRINQTLNPLTRNVFSNTDSFQRAVNSLSPSVSGAANAISGLASRNFADRLNRTTSVMQQRNNLLNQQIGLDTNAVNSSRLNRNKVLSQVGGLGAGLGTNLANIEGNRVSNLLAARGANFSAQAKLSNQLSQSLFNAGSALSLINPSQTGQVANNGVSPLSGINPNAVPSQFQQSNIPFGPNVNGISNYQFGQGQVGNLFNNPLGGGGFNANRYSLYPY